MMRAPSPSQSVTYSDDGGDEIYSSAYSDNLESFRTRSLSRGSASQATAATGRTSFSDIPRSIPEGRPPSDGSGVGEGIPKFTTFAFSVGHVLNDMAACCWFTYLLIYLENTVLFHPGEAGVIMLSGQIADGIATPIVGLLSDSSSSMTVLGWRFCKRTKFHFFGTILVALCYSGVWIYSPFDGCETCNIGNIWMTLYYCLAAALFNVGWASVQVSHLALITDLSNDENIRTRLTSKRYSFTILSNLMVFNSYLGLIKGVDPIDEATKAKYRYLGGFTLSVGLLCTLFFYIGMHRRCVSQDKFASSNKDPLSNSDDMTTKLLQDVNQGSGSNSDIENDGNRGGRKHWSEWLKSIEFYKVGTVYMATRALINIVMVYISFFLVKTLQTETALLAIIPCLLYVASFIATLFLGRINRKLGRKNSFYLGGLISCGASLSCFYIDKDNTSFIYLIAVLLGLGTATIMVGAVSSVNDLIGEEVSSGAFVYGCMSFTDKLGSGLLIILIQLHRDNVCLDDDDDMQHTNPECANFIRDTMAFVPVFCGLLGILTMIVVKRR